MTRAFFIGSDDAHATTTLPMTAIAIPATHPPPMNGGWEQMNVAVVTAFFFSFQILHSLTGNYHLITLLYVALPLFYVFNEINLIILFVEITYEKNILRLAKAKMSKTCFTKTDTHLWKTKAIFQRQCTSLGDMYLALQRCHVFDSLRLWHLWYLRKDIKDAKDELDIFLMTWKVEKCTAARV
jgi:hypothetical protein